MLIDWSTPVEVLTRGDDVAYIDLDAGELMHWKYIKRVKLPNGKYRYYYDIGQDDRAEMDYRKNELSKAERRKEDAHKKRSEDFERVSNAKNEKDRAAAVKDFNTSVDRMDKAMKDTDTARQQYNNAVKSYEKTPLYKIEKSKNAIKKGANAISKLFSNLRRKK